MLKSLSIIALFLALFTLSMVGLMSVDTWWLRWVMLYFTFSTLCCVWFCILILWNELTLTQKEDSISTKEGDTDGTTIPIRDHTHSPDNQGASPPA